MNITYKQINHDIRNYKLLKEIHFKYMESLSKEELIKIIILYNEVQENLNNLFNDDVIQSSSYK